MLTGFRTYGSPAPAGSGGENAEQTVVSNLGVINPRRFKTLKRNQGVSTEAENEPSMSLRLAPQPSVSSTKLVHIQWSVLLAARGNMTNYCCYTSQSNLYPQTRTSVCTENRRYTSVGLFVIEQVRSETYSLPFNLSVCPTDAVVTKLQRMARTINNAVQSNNWEATITQDTARGAGMIEQRNHIIILCYTE